MSMQNAPLPDPERLFLEPTSREVESVTAHHPKPKPADHMCTCGKVREACVHDEVRALWSGASTKKP